MALDEIFFQSMETIAKSVVEKHNHFDVTWFCTIVDNSHADIGVYTVEYQNNRYTVQSENTSYLIGDYVKVTIPNNNIDGIKFIAGKYSPADSNRPVNYVAPLDEILAVRTEQAPSAQPFGIIANGPEAIKEVHRFLSLPQELDMCDSLVVTADFKTLFTDVIKGEYGLRIEVIGDSLATGKENVAIAKVFTSRDFIGDPYRMEIFSEQQLRIDISSLFNIKQIIIYLCQDDLFETSKGRLKASPVPDIFVRNITIYFGTSALKASSAPFEIKCYDSQYYNSDVAGNIKSIRNYWYNYNEQGAYIGYSDGIVDTEVDIVEGKYVYDELTYEASKNYVTELSGYNSSKLPLNEPGLIIKRNDDKLKKITVKTLELLGSNYLGASLQRSEQLMGVGALAKQRSTVEQAIKKLNEYTESVEAKYKAIIYFASQRVAGKMDMIVPEIPNPFWYVRTTALLNNIRLALDDTSALSPANRQYYETNVLPPIEQDILNKINDCINEAAVLETEILKHLEEFSVYYNDTEYWKPYIPSTLEEFNNKYCIYWYRYDGFESQNIDEHGGANWSRIPELDNVGLVLAASGGLKPMGELTDSTYLAQVMLDRGRPQPYERFKAILFFNHTPYVSQELVFENQGAEYQKQERDLISLTLVNCGESKDSYQFYGPNLLLLDLSQANVPRQLKAIYESESQDFDPKGMKIVWRFPNGSTQIRCGDMSRFSLIESDELDYLAGYDSYKGYYYDASQLDVTYYIAESFEPNNLQNTIICQLTAKDGTIVEASKTFAFSTFGNSGTNYTLVVEGSGIVLDAPDSIAEIEPKLLDYDGNEVQAKFTLRWTGPALVSQDTSQEKPYHLRNKNFNSEVNGSILLIDTRASVEGRTVTLSTPFLPKVSQNTKYSIQGPSYVIYNSHGVDPVYSKLPYILYDEEHKPIDASWRIRYFYQDAEFDLEEIKSAGNHAVYGLDAHYLPTLNPKTNELIVSPMYLTGMENYFFILEAIKDGHVYWGQAIYIGQNRYASNTLNNWNGKLDINEESGTILAPLIAAGRKNSDNSFEGIVMGDVARYGVETADSVTFNKGHPSTGTGLYGFNQGAQSFGFLTNGTAFIGKAGAGRLWFDGNRSQISNAGYYMFESDAERLGTELDLDDGTLHILSPGAEVYLGAKEHNNAYFSIRPRERVTQEVVESRSALSPVQEKDIRQTIGTQKVIDSDTISFEPTGAFLTLGLTKLKEPPYKITGNIWVPEMTDRVTINFNRGGKTIETATIAARITEDNNYVIVIDRDVTASYDTIVFECYGNTDKAYYRSPMTLTYGDIKTDKSYYNLERALINISDSASWIQTRGFEENKFVYVDKRFRPTDINIEDIDLDLIQDTMGRGAQILLDTKAGIKAATFEIISSNLVVTSQGDRLPYFGVFTPWIDEEGELLKDTGGKPLIYISKDEYFLQTQDYSSNTGLLFDLKNGKLKAYSGFYMQAGDVIIDGDNGRISVGVSNNTYPFNLYNKMYVDNSGKITANGLNITGGSIAIESKNDAGELVYSFKVTPDGNLTAVNATFTGNGTFSGVVNATGGLFQDVTVASGSIAGWFINPAEWIELSTGGSVLQIGYIASIIDSNKNKESPENQRVRLNADGSFNMYPIDWIPEETEKYISGKLPNTNWWIESNGTTHFTNVEIEDTGYIKFKCMVGEAEFDTATLGYVRENGVTQFQFDSNSTGLLFNIKSPVRCTSLTTNVIKGTNILTQPLTFSNKGSISFLADTYVDSTTGEDERSDISMRSTARILMASDHIFIGTVFNNTGANYETNNITINASQINLNGTVYINGKKIE